MKPWACPKCNTVYAPWVDRCECERMWPVPVKKDRAELPRNWVGNCVTCGCPSWSHDNLGVCYRKGCGSNCRRFKQQSADGLGDVVMCACGHPTHSHDRAGACVTPGCPCGRK